MRKLLGSSGRLNMELKEDEVPVNNIGMGNIQGTGVGPQGEPGKYLKKRKLAEPMMRRYKGFKEFTYARSGRAK